MQATSRSLLIAKIVILGFIFIAASASCLTKTTPPPYELIHQTDTTTEQTGSVTLKCRDGQTAEELDISEINFFLNRSSAADPCLRERGDIIVVRVESTGIKFNLTRRLEGNYTCGKRVDVANVRESLPRSFVCKWDLFAFIELNFNFTTLQLFRLSFHCCVLLTQISLQCQVIESSCLVQSNQVHFLSNTQWNGRKETLA